MASPLGRQPEGAGVWWHGWQSLALAHAVAVLAGAASALLYGAWLDPRGFAQWAGALALARALQLLLDGGLRVALVRRPHWPGVHAMRRLQRWVGWAAAGLLVLLAGAVAAALFERRIAAEEALLWWGASAAYLLTYPPVLVALARLERAGHFASVGRAEGAGTLVEFVGPVPLMALGVSPPLAFVAALLLGRSLRCGLLHRAAVRLPPAQPDPTGLAVVLRDALPAQAVAALSLIRDLQHLWWLAPWVGAVWGGRYAFAVLATSLVTQVAAQTASRVALPQLAATSPPRHWPLIRSQVAWLSVATVPPLALLMPVLYVLDHGWWQGRWADSLPLVGWLSLRMLGGLLSTPLGTWMMAALGPSRSAGVHARWTLAEVTLALALVGLFGPAGLAVAGAAGVWVGNALMLHALRRGGAFVPPHAGRELLLVALVRPAAWVAVLLAMGAWLGIRAGHGPISTLAAIGLLPLAWWAEPALRRCMRSHRWWPSPGRLKSETSG